MQRHCFAFFAALVLFLSPKTEALRSPLSPKAFQLLLSAHVAAPCDPAESTDEEARLEPVNDELKPVGLAFFAPSFRLLLQPFIDLNQSLTHAGHHHHELLRAGLIDLPPPIAS